LKRVVLSIAIGVNARPFGNSPEIPKLVTPKFLVVKVKSVSVNFMEGAKLGLLIAIVFDIFYYKYS
jgi:hypothetical protein